MKNLFWALAILVVIIAAGVVLVVLPGKSQAPTTATSTPDGSIFPSTVQYAPGDDYSNLIVIDSPKPNAVIASTTLVITGKARGTWYFEGSFPVTVSNYGGTIIARGHATALGDWMTNDFVPFSVTIDLGSHPSEPLGVTVSLENDNPSGDPANSKEAYFDLVLQ